MSGNQNGKSAIKTSDGLTPSGRGLQSAMLGADSAYGAPWFVSPTSTWERGVAPTSTWEKDVAPTTSGQAGPSCSGSLAVGLTLFPLLKGEPCEPGRVDDLVGVAWADRRGGRGRRGRGGGSS